MLSRFISKASHFKRLLTPIPSHIHQLNSKPIFRSPILLDHSLNCYPRIPHFSFLSTRSGNGNSGDDSATSTTDLWRMSSESDQNADSVFSEESRGLEGINNQNGDLMRNFEGKDLNLGGDDVLGEVEAGGHEDYAMPEDFKPWDLSKEGEEDVFGVVGETEESLSGLRDVSEEGSVGVGKSEQDKQLEAEGKALTAIIKGPDRAFGDLIAASGITDEMLDNLIALKDFEGIQGLPPLSKIEEMRYEKNTRKSSRAEIERQKQDEVAKARVRLVDVKGRAYGTGRRKCSIARVWIEPGDGKFVVNDKDFDVYFPMLDQRATLLRPFTETKTLGMWDVNCTVKGGGTSGQVGAIRLGISKALQNWEPGFRPPLKQAGFLTRDSRVVERKKPGKAKARKSFQWVKR